MLLTRSPPLNNSLQLTGLRPAGPRVLLLSQSSDHKAVFCGFAGLWACGVRPSNKKKLRAGSIEQRYVPMYSTLVLWYSGTVVPPLVLKDSREGGAKLASAVQKKTSNPTLTT